ncbi:hypothetical protein [Longitalea luteola]|uniref:hypothetical protein n=1 Tax=Longitalea luteola TaxID=2812563 RepID=UPI001A95EEA7|nr:hypothetical protein [Longitalea luteola]
MDTKKKNPEKLTGEAEKAAEKDAGNKHDIPGKTATSDSDMEPEEIVSSKADTDVPMDGQVNNDAVLRGEPHAEDKTINGPSEEKS